MKICPKCGSEKNKDSQKYCGDCGVPLTPTSDMPSVQTEVSKARIRKPGSSMLLRRLVKETNVFLFSEDPAGEGFFVELSQTLAESIPKYLILISVAVWALILTVLPLLSTAFMTILAIEFIYMAALLVAICLINPRLWEFKASRYLTIGMPLFGLLILILCSPPSNYDKGELALSNKDWAAAVDYFSRINSGESDYDKSREDYVAALTQRQLDSARSDYEEHNWASTIEALSLPDVRSLPEVLALRDSATYFLNLTSLLELMKSLSLVIDLPSTERENVLRAIFTNSKYQSVIRTLVPNGATIADNIFHWNALDSEIAKEQQDYDSSSQYYSARYSADSLSFEEIKQDIQVRQFAIRAAFPYAGELIAYDAVDMSTYARVVVLAREGQIPESPLQRIGISLLVRRVGNQTYTQTNEFGVTTMVELPTFETTSYDKNPDMYAREIKDYQDTIVTLKAQFERKTTIQKSNFQEIEKNLIAELLVLLKAKQSAVERSQPATSALNADLTLSDVMNFDFHLPATDGANDLARKIDTRHTVKFQNGRGKDELNTYWIYGLKGSPDYAKSYSDNIEEWPTLSNDNPMVAFGDLDNDNIQDCAVVIAVLNQFKQREEYLAILKFTGYRYEHVALGRVYDSKVIEAIRIENGNVIMDLKGDDNSVQTTTYDANGQLLY